MLWRTVRTSASSCTGPKSGVPPVGYRLVRICGSTDTTDWPTDPLDDQTRTALNLYREASSDVLHLSVPSFYPASLRRTRAVLDAGALAVGLPASIASTWLDGEINTEHAAWRSTALAVEPRAASAQPAEAAGSHHDQVRRGGVDGLEDGRSHVERRHLWQGPGDVRADLGDAVGLEHACGVVDPALDASGLPVDHAQDGDVGVGDPRHPGQGLGGTPRVE